MFKYCIVKKNHYFDSVTLMGISKKLSDIDSVIKVSVSMGTDLNKEVLATSGLSNEVSDKATPNDLIIAFELTSESELEAALSNIEKALVSRKSQKDNESNAAGIKSALNIFDANFALISLPGNYAARETKKALNAGLNVMLFSDNVSIEDELSLKKLAHKKSLLLMGPDCGTAIINQKALCFANKVKAGNVGIVAASGTGAQEFSVLLDKNNVGISQLIGTGGRDLSHEIGGIMMCDGINLLAKDDATDLIVLISKPPAVDVVEKIMNVIKQIDKPVVTCFLSEEKQGDSTNTIKEGVYKVLDKLNINYDQYVPNLPNLNDLTPQQKFLRGIFCGGTLTEEAKIVFKQVNPNEVLFTNHDTEVVLNSSKNTLIDMGDDAFTLGSAHPMIDPTKRNNRIIQEALDPETAVILVDVVLGFGAHENPSQEVVETIKLAKQQGSKAVFIAYVLGTDQDKQNLAYQTQLLKQENIIVAPTNYDAALLASLIIKEINKETK